MALLPHRDKIQIEILVKEKNMVFFSSLDDKNFVAQIQRILRDLSFIDGGVGSLGVDGIYDDATRGEVMKFQDKYGVSPTGVVDYETWELLNKIWEIRQSNEARARAVYILPRFQKYEITPFARDNALYVIQHMLETISRDYSEIEGIELNGIYDEKTQNAIRYFKRKNLLDDTAIIDAITFNRLADEYERVNSYSQ